MATGLRHFKIISLKPNYIANKTVSVLRKVTCCKLQPENISEEVPHGTTKATVNYFTTHRTHQSDSTLLLKTSSIEQFPDNWENSIENYKVTYFQNHTAESQSHNQINSLPLPTVFSHSYDSLNLPIKVYDHWMDEPNSTVESNILTENVPMIFTGYLDSSRYYMYCLGTEKEFTSLKLSDFEHHFISSAHKMSSSKEPEPTGKPTESQLKNVYLKLSESLPTLFVQPLDYTIYHRNVTFENNIRGVTTHGIGAYVQQIALIRILGHLRYAHVKLEILKITHHLEDSTVKVRWRIRGISGFRALFMFWKFKLWEWKNMIEKETEWIDGFSVFHVGSDGLVYKHICDKVMPDEEKVENKAGNVAMKFALLLGLLPRPEQCLDAFFNGFAQQLPCD